MGTRLRLKATVDITGFPASDQVILTALQRYGVIVADNGSAMFISGTPDERWNNAELDQLKTLTASDFEVVQMGPIYAPGNVPTGPAPALTNLSANPETIAPGQTSTLSWSSSDASYTIVSPEVGPTRATSVIVRPAATTTYRIYATNQFGRTTRSVRVTVE